VLGEIVSRTVDRFVAGAAFDAGEPPERGMVGDGFMRRVTFVLAGLRRPSLGL